MVVARSRLVEEASQSMGISALATRVLHGGCPVCVLMDQKCECVIIYIYIYTDMYILMAVSAGDATADRSQDPSEEPFKPSTQMRTNRKRPNNPETQSLQSCPGAVESARAQGLKEPVSQARFGRHRISMHAVAQE